MANPDHSLLVTTRTIPSTPYLVVVAVFFFVFRFGLVLFSVVCRFVCFHVKLFVEGVFTFYRFATWQLKVFNFPLQRLTLENTP